MPNFYSDRRMDFLFPVKSFFSLGLEVSLAHAFYLINDDVGYLSARKERLWQTKRKSNVILAYLRVFFG